MYLTVTVTQEDIDNGVREDTDACAIARALNRLPGISDASVYNRFACVTVEGRRYRVALVLPDNARRFIRRFDKGLGVRPNTFVLEEV